MTFNILITPLSNYPNRGREVTQSFREEINAEIFILALPDEKYRCTRLNFKQNFTEEEVKAEASRHRKLIDEATRLEKWAQQRTNNNFRNPENFPCEVCGEKHRNYECCNKCMFDNHRCHACGEELGHAEFSSCYILEGLGE